ncbi:small integral membrane protein 20-like [Ciona intestinalis]
MVFLSNYLLKDKPRFDQVKRPLFRNGRVAIAFIVSVGVALYPIYVFPLYHVEKYQKIQDDTRKEIDQKKVQPGGMRVWSNPFEPKSSRDKDLD